MFELIRMHKKITTPRLHLVSGSLELLDAAIEGDDSLAAFLQVSVPEHWSSFGSGMLHHARSMVRVDESMQQWWAYFPVHIQDQILLGTCGYKGPPQDGMVEIGYEIMAHYRGQGLATEMATGLIKHAFNHPEISLVLAHTLAEENASGSILKKCGFIKTAELEDPEDGLIWRWELSK